MPKDFDRCVDAGGRVRRISGPDKKFGVKKGEYRNVCFLNGESFLGEVKTVKSNARVTIKALRASPELIVTQELSGKEFYVVPIVALVEGVLQCATCPEPELITKEVFGKNVEAWNGRPVTEGHPQRRGQFVSANLPDVLTHDAIGFIANARVVDNALKMDLFLDSNRISPELLERLLAGEEVEVSTGYFAELQPVGGTFNSKPFSAVQTEIIPDHLAILSETEIGACSWLDGCGAPRNNIESLITTTLSSFRIGTDDNTGTVDNTFRLVFSGTDGGQEMPLARANCSPGEKCESCARPRFDLRIRAALSDNDTRAALQSVLQDLEANSIIEAVFEDNFVYSTFDMESGRVALFERSYSIANDGTVTIGDSPILVRAETEFVPVVRAQKSQDKPDTEGRGVDKTEIVTALIASDKTRFSESDREWLDGLTEDQLAIMQPVEAEAQDESEPEAEPEAEAEAEEEPLSAEDFISSAPEEIREVLQEGLNLHRAKRDRLVDSIIANKHARFSKDELRVMSTDMLERLAEVCKPADFSGRGGPRKVSNSKDGVPEVPNLKERISARRAS